MLCPLFVSPFFSEQMENNPTQEPLYGDERGGCGASASGDDGAVQGWEEFGVTLDDLLLEPSPVSSSSFSSGSSPDFNGYAGVPVRAPPVPGGLYDPDPRQRGKNALNAKANREKKKAEQQALQRRLAAFEAAERAWHAERAALNERLALAQAEVASIKTLLATQTAWGSVLSVLTQSDNLSLVVGAEKENEEASAASSSFPPSISSAAAAASSSSSSSSSSRSKRRAAEPSGDARPAKRAATKAPASTATDVVVPLHINLMIRSSAGNDNNNNN